MRIAIWGNSGSGKSTLAIKLALSLVSAKKDVMLFDTDYAAPQFNVWYPKKNMVSTSSLSVLLDNAVTAEALSSKSQKIKDNLVCYGYCKDFASNSIPSRSDTALQLMNLLGDPKGKFNEFYSVIDCMSCPITDYLSYAALTSADAVIVAFTPDVKGMSWYDANVKMFEENWKDNKKLVIRAFNQATITSPTSNIENILGTMEYYLPYDRALKEELYSGNLGSNSYKQNARNYANVVDTMREQLVDAWGKRY